MLQRINIKLKVLNNILLTYNYQYQLGCEINKKITLADIEFGEKFHKEGLRKNKSQKNFKLLNPMFQFNNAIMDKDGIILNKNDIITLVIGGDKTVITKVLNGLYEDNKINIDGNIFEFIGVDIEKLPNLKQINIYKVEGVLIESIQDQNKKVKYLDIMNPKFVEALKENLKRKYKLLYNRDYTGELKIGVEDFLKIKNKTINIKGYNIKGFGKFNIILKANKDMQKVAYCCGLGTHNMYGGGFLKYITGGDE